MIDHSAERLITDLPAQAERVLIVDDDPSMRTALMESVRRLGFDVQGAMDGADAVERVSRYKPWLVVTDLKMPRLGARSDQGNQESFAADVDGSDDRLRNSGDRCGGDEIRGERLPPQALFQRFA